MQYEERLLNLAQLVFKYDVSCTGIYVSTDAMWEDAEVMGIIIKSSIARLVKEGKHPSALMFSSSSLATTKLAQSISKSLTTSAKRHTGPRNSEYMMFVASTSVELSARHNHELTLS